ncbi:hypothetical protein BSKO_07155 [Bryopsis sp. KO-2023]|nr:hypothetical protein BSKO_07155 [Bryopsis sp. KO-2023]
MRRGVNAAACSAVFIAILFGFSAGRHLTQLGEPDINGTIVSVPAGYAKCFVKVDLPQPDINCKEPKNPEEPYFQVNTDVDLGLGELQSCMIEARFPIEKKPLVACLAIPPIIIEEVILAGRELALPYGAVKCTATRLQKGEEPSVKCDSPGPGSTEEYFAKGAMVEIPEGPFQRCEITPQNSAILLSCLELAQVVIPKPEVNGLEVTVPVGAAKCSAKNLKGESLSVSCEPPMSGKEEPTFGEGTTVTMPAGAFESCEMTPGEKNKADLNCKELEFVVIDDALIKKNEIIIPEGAALCMATSFKGEPIAVCVPAPFGAEIPIFSKGVFFELPVGDFGRCIFTPDQGAECDIVTTPDTKNVESVDAEASGKPESTLDEEPAVSDKEVVDVPVEEASEKKKDKKNPKKKAKKKAEAEVNLEVADETVGSSDNVETTAEKS